MGALLAARVKARETQIAVLYKVLGDLIDIIWWHHGSKQNYSELFPPADGFVLPRPSGERPAATAKNLKVRAGRSTGDAQHHLGRREEALLRPKPPRD